MRHGPVDPSHGVGHAVLPVLDSAGAVRVVRIFIDGEVVGIVIVTPENIRVGIMRPAKKRHIRQRPDGRFNSVSPAIEVHRARRARREIFTAFRLRIIEGVVLKQDVARVEHGRQIASREWPVGRGSIPWKHRIYYHAAELRGETHSGEQD